MGIKRAIQTNRTNFDQSSMQHYEINQTARIRVRHSFAV